MLYSVTLLPLLKTCICLIPLQTQSDLSVHVTQGGGPPESYSFEVVHITLLMVIGMLTSHVCSFSFTLITLYSTTVDSFNQNYYTSSSIIYLNQGMYSLFRNKIIRIMSNLMLKVVILK